MEAVSFGGDIKLLAPGGAGLNSSCLLQGFVSHHCGKPLRGNKNKQKTNKQTSKKTMLWDYCSSTIATIVLTHDEVLYTDVGSL